VGGGVAAGAAVTAPPLTAPPPAGAAETAGVTETAGVGDTVESGDGDTLVAPVPSVSPAAETPGLAAPGPIGDDAVVRAVAGVDVLGAVTAVVAGSTTLPPAGRGGRAGDGG